jgi:hypothetical protein
MTPAEKIADRIAKNRAADDRLAQRGKTPSLRRIKVSFAGDDVNFTHEETFPRIAFIIDTLCGATDEFAGHREIVAAMTRDDDELGWLLGQIVARDPDKRSREEWASIMMSWFSQAFTEGRNPYTNDFERDSSTRPYRYRRRR